MTGIGTLVPSAIRVVRAATPPAPLTANPPSWSGERVCAEVPDDDDNVRVRIVFPDDQPIFGPIPNRDTHGPSPNDRRRTAAAPGSASSASIALSTATSNAAAPACRGWHRPAGAASRTRTRPSPLSAA